MLVGGSLFKGILLYHLSALWRCVQLVEFAAGATPIRCCCMRDEGASALVLPQERGNVVLRLQWRAHKEPRPQLRALHGIGALVPVWYVGLGCITTLPHEGPFIRETGHRYQHALTSPGNDQIKQGSMRLLQVMDGHELPGMGKELTPRPHQHWASHEARGVSDGLHGDASGAGGHCEKVKSQD